MAAPYFVVALIGDDFSVRGFLAKRGRFAKRRCGAEGHRQESDARAIAKAYRGPGYADVRKLFPTAENAAAASGKDSEGAAL